MKAEKKILQAWLIYAKEDADKNEAFIRMHREAGKKLGMEFDLIYAERLSITVEKGSFCLRYEGKLRERPDFVLCRTRDWLLTRQIEKMGLPVFNNSEVSLIGNNKAIAYQEVAALDVPVIDTCFCRRRHLEGRLLECGLEKPVVVKSVSGHGGSQVFLYERKEQLKEILFGIGDEDAVIQPLVSGPGEDIRVYVIGNRVRGCVLRKAENGFKANFSLGGRVFPYQLTKKEEAMLIPFFEHWHFDFAGIDFIRDKEGRLLFNEVEDVVGSRMYYQCYEDDIVTCYLDYIRKECLLE